MTSTISNLPKTSQKHPIIGNLIVSFAICLLLLPSATIAWCLSRYGGSDASDPRAECSIRRTDNGFVGNSDFYGLEIRLGIYSQWVAYVLSDHFVASQRRNMAGAYGASSFALGVALLLLVFQRSCVFTAEIIVLLHFLVGGCYLILYDFLHEGSEIGSLFRYGHTLRGLQLLPSCILLVLSPIDIWFWIRLARFHEDGFAPTPGAGTSMFLLAKVTPTHLHTAAGLICDASFLLSVHSFFSLCSRLITCFDDYFCPNSLCWASRIVRILRILPMGFYMVVIITILAVGK